MTRLRPGERDPLSTFLRHTIDTRDTNPSQLARKLNGVEGKDAKTWERAIRRWLEPKARRLSPANADHLGETLNADFSAYVEAAPDPRDLIDGILDRMDAVDARLEAIEARLPHPG